MFDEVAYSRNFEVKFQGFENLHLLVKKASYEWICEDRFVTVHFNLFMDGMDELQKMIKDSESGGYVFIEYKIYDADYAKSVTMCKGRFNLESIRIDNDVDGGTETAIMIVSFREVEE